MCGRIRAWIDQCLPLLDTNLLRLAACAPSRRRPSSCGLWLLRQFLLVCSWHGHRIRRSGYDARTACFWEAVESGEILNWADRLLKSLATYAGLEKVRSLSVHRCSNYPRYDLEIDIGRDIGGLAIATNHRHCFCRSIMRGFN